MRSSIKAAAFVGLALAASAPVLASSFGANNLVIYRMGDEDNSAGTQPCPVYLDQVTKAGSLVNSLAMPTTVNGNQHRLVGTISGLGGMLTRSPDGKYLAVPGYDADVNSGVNPTGFSTLGTMGIVDQFGNVDTSTVLADSGNYIGAVTNGTDIWYTNDAGVLHTVKGQGLTVNDALAFTDNEPHGQVNGINIYNNQLYYAGARNKKIGSSSDRYLGILAMGTGTPTSGTQTSTQLHLDAQGGNTETAFLMLNVPGAGAPSGLNTAYIVDPIGTTAEKYSLTGTTWNDDGAISLGGSAYGITGEVVNGNVNLYATTGSTLVSFTDSTGFGGSVGGSSATKLLTAPDGETFRGVAFAPVPEPASGLLLLIGGVGFIRRRRT